MEIFKIVAVAIMGCILILLIKQLKPEFTVVVMVATTIILLIYILKYFTQIFAVFDEIVSKTGVNKDLFVVLIKTYANTYSYRDTQINRKTADLTPNTAKQQI